MNVERELILILTNVLALGARGDMLMPSSKLLGTIPELDSIAVISLVTAIEEHFDVEFDDDEITASTFETIASLEEIIRRKLPS